MSEPTPDPNSFSHPINATDLELWRESLAHLRHLGDDVWNGLKLFLSLNCFFIGAILVVINFSSSNPHPALLLFALSVAGLAMTLVARYILKRHRIYYLQMLVKKSLIEDRLGFYQKKFSGDETDLAFPWRLTPEVVEELKRTPEKWIQKSIRAKGTIARWQFFLYDALIVLYVSTTFWAILGMLSRTEP